MRFHDTRILFSRVNQLTVLVTSDQKPDFRAIQRLPVGRWGFERTPWLSRPKAGLHQWDKFWAPPTTRLDSTLSTRPDAKVSAGWRFWHVLPPIRTRISIASDLSIPLGHAKSPGPLSGSHQKSLKIVAAFVNFGAKSHLRSELGSDLDQQEDFWSLSHDLGASRGVLKNYLGFWNIRKWQIPIQFKHFYIGIPRFSVPIR